MSISPHRRTFYSCFTTLFFLLLTPAQSLAQESLTEALDQYLHKQTQGLPGKVSYSIGRIDSRTQARPCSVFEPFLPAGSRLWGKATLGVRCLAPSPWTIYVRVQVNVSGTYLITARPIPAGRQLVEEDIQTRNGNLSSLPANIMTDQAEAVGKSAKTRIAAGQILRSDFLIAPWAVQRGQHVRLISKGVGFNVSGEGKALNNAADGELIQIRTASGQTISGIARPGGIVEVSY